jgi:hypothetical protein
MKALALKSMSPAEMAELETADLADMQAEVAEVAELAKALKANLDAAIVAKFGDKIDAACAEKHTGTAHILDGDFDLEINVPKKIDWDQVILKRAEILIRDEWGDDPEEYISITRKVSESAWKSWPTRLKEMFADARTEGTAKPQFKIARKEAK